MKRYQLRVWAMVAVFACASVGAHAAGIVNKNIVIGGQTAAVLNVSNPAVFDNGTSGGVTVSASADGQYPPIKAGYELRWVQLISTSHPLSTATAANTPYFDPGELDTTGDNHPFYWNTNLVANDAANHPEYWYKNKQFNAGKGINFFDEPKRAIANKPVNWLGELNLVCWETGSTKFGVMWTGTYGFDINNAGTVSVNGINELANPAYLTQARLTAAFNGWTMENPTNCLEIVPEPATLLLVAVGSLVVCSRRRRAA
jgi:hypothetical protein